jgi:hypothetical protein
MTYRLCNHFNGQDAIKIRKRGKLVHLFVKVA